MRGFSRPKLPQRATPTSSVASPGSYHLGNFTQRAPPTPRRLPASADSADRQLRRRNQTPDSSATSSVTSTSTTLLFLRRRRQRQRRGYNSCSTSALSTKNCNSGDIKKAASRARQNRRNRAAVAATMMTAPIRRVGAITLLPPNATAVIEAGTTALRPPTAPTARNGPAPHTADTTTDPAARMTTTTATSRSEAHRGQDLRILLLLLPLQQRLHFHYHRQIRSRIHSKA